MAWLKLNWMFLTFSLNIFVVSNSLPFIHVPATSTEVLMPDLPKEVEERIVNDTLDDAENDTQSILGNKKHAANEEIINNKSLTDLNEDDNESKFIRPGLTVTRYTIQITIDGNTFNGRAVIDVEVDEATRNVPLRFHSDGLTIQSVELGLLTGANMVENPFDLAGIVLEIRPRVESSQYRLIIQYTGPIRNDGRGLFLSEFNEVNYMAMNLHPINARRVFPCIDEPSITSMVSFSFVDMDFPRIVSNAAPEENNPYSFRPVEAPVHSFGMVAHNLNNVNLPVANVLLYVRPGIVNQDSQASVTINFMFTNLNDWTQRPYDEILLNQDGQMHIFALPDSDRDWYALSTVCIWEPNILMDPIHSVAQRKTALSSIAEAMARQWFGFVVFPQNWRHQWIITGLYKYAAYDLLTTFQHDPEGTFINLLDMNAIFVTDIIQESLLRDSYTTAQGMELDENIFDENLIRQYMNGIINYKAPAILSLLRLVLNNDDQDYVQLAARALLRSRNRQSVNTLIFLDAIQSEWFHSDNKIIDDLDEFLLPYITHAGYPVINVAVTDNNVQIIQEHFSFGNTAGVNFQIPLTFTTSTNPNFDNIQPIRMIQNAVDAINVALGEDDWILFNIQGQGYYRVNYDSHMWPRIIDALNDPERREEIHELNRATLLDDSLNLARGDRLDYDVALNVALTMEHETEYAVWKAFVRNMKFLKKFLIAMITEDDSLDQDIYVRMIRRTIVAFEEEIGFTAPAAAESAMRSLTRGLVMDHACRANYDPCIAAAVDWFFDPNDDEVVNPNIPRDLRPAVYCTMVREGEENIIEMLEAQLEIEPSHYERLVILESMGCSQDINFIRNYLESTIAPDSPYGVEERFRIFKAIAESSYENLIAARDFMINNVRDIRNAYGGPEKLDSAILVLTENMGSFEQLLDFQNWLRFENQGLEDSQDLAVRASLQVTADLEWSRENLQYVYDWIDENDAPSLIVSSLLIFISLCLALFNH